MSKGYVFWRNQRGEAHRVNDGQFAPSAILAEIGKKATVTPEGISWPLFGLHELELAAHSSAVVIGPDDEELNETDASSLMAKAIRIAIRNGGGQAAIKPGEVIKEANKLAADYFRQPAKSYTLVSSLSVVDLPVKSVVMAGSRIAHVKRNGKKYPLPPAIKGRTTEHLNIAKHLQGTKYQSIGVNTKGRTFFEASEKGQDVLNLLRGLWTLFGTYGSWSIRMSTTPIQESLSAVHIGPVHTLHLSDGSLATEMYWYEADYSGDQKLFDPKQKWPQIEKNRRTAMRLLMHHPFRGEVEKLIRRYAMALDHANFDIAFLQLWGVLEKLTDTVGANYDETIRRAAWIYEHRAIKKEVLQHLRFRRNSYVHGAQSGGHRDQIVYSIKSFVESHLLRLIRNDFKIRSLREYGDCLQLPTNRKVLLEQRRLRNMVLRMIDTAPAKRASRATRDVD